jgi:hypothetical protein
MQTRYGAAAAPPLRAVTPHGRHPDLHHIYHIEPEDLGAPGGLVNDAQGPGAAAALLALREEGRRGPGNCET